ncbi:MAG: hypothetical protein JWO41_277 [Candidatus Saccharibacteria bacterium]|nr:hypothetical protein [Candidatus Saccharibacteria bacterium]
MLKHHFTEKGKAISVKELAVLAATGSRLIIGGYMARNVLHHKPVLGSMAIFLLADHFDGVLARKMGVDTPKRRVIDAMVDRAAIAMNFAALAVVNEEARPFIGLLAAREAVVGMANWHVLKETGAVVQGAGAQKLGSLSVALFGVAGAQYPEFTDAAGIATVAINTVLATEYVENALHTKP